MKEAIRYERALRWVKENITVLISLSRACENDIFAVCMPFKEEMWELLVKSSDQSEKVNKDYNIKLSAGYISSMNEAVIYRKCTTGHPWRKSCKGKFVQSLAYYMRNDRNMRQEQFISMSKPDWRTVWGILAAQSICTDRSTRALVALNHPEKGICPPGEFIPVYEAMDYRQIGPVYCPCLYVLPVAGWGKNTKSNLCQCIPGKYL